MKKQLIFVGIILLFHHFAQSQATNGATSNNNYFGGNYLGWDGSNGANPLLIKTNNITRLHINGSTAGYGVNTSGFMGLGISAPAAPLHIVGQGQQNAQGWTRGLTLTNQGTITWDGGGGQGFFMAHPSNNPGGNFYAGRVAGLNASDIVDYTYTISVNTQLGINPLGTVDFYKNVLVYDAANERRLAVNVLNPLRAAHFYDGGSNNSTDAQLRLSSVSGDVDFRSSNLGQLHILPSGNKVAINTTTPATATIDVAGDARIRNVASIPNPDAIIVGAEAIPGNPNDMNLRRLDFPPNPNWVLFGDGTWGPLPIVPPSPSVLANNGCSKIGNTIQWGEVYNSPPLVPLLNDREIVMDDHNVVFSGKGRVGIGQSFPNLPTEQLDVVGNGRFRLLPNIINQANSAVNKVVMVDNNGVLRWKDLSSFSGVSNAVNGAWINGLNQVEWGTNPLDHDTEIPMNGKNVAFTNLPGGSSLTNNFKIGGDATPLPVKLTVLNDVESIGALIVSNSSIFGGTTRSGVVGVSENAFIPTGVVGKGLNGVRVYGVQGSGTNGSVESIGVYGFATTSLGNGSIYGGKFRAESSTIDVNYGVHAHATGSPKTNIGGYFTAQGGTMSIGVYGEANSSDPGATVWAGYFAGPIQTTGSSIPSDNQFKTNINPIQSAESILVQINPVTFNYLQSGNAQYLHFDSDNKFGMIAQEVEQILPELVRVVTHPAKLDSLGNVVVPEFEYKTLNYEAFIPILIKGFQEQDARIDSLTNINYTVNNNNDSLEQVVSDLNARLTQLENCLSNILPALCNANSMAVQSTPEEAQKQLEKTINVTLSNRNNIVLNQNVPNPFAESTVITYSIPATVQKAQIHFYDGTGKLISSVEIAERGNGQLNVFANDLSSGVYTYSLVADGQIVATKRMMKQ
jgi:hypothetical protein